MTQTGSGRPSLASRPISGYSIASNGNFAGVGSNNVRMPPMAAQFPAMSNDEGHASDAAGPFGDMHSRGYSTSGASAVGSHAEGRPASSFYALDGHTGMDTPTSAGSDPTRKHYGNSKSITSTSRPTSEFARPHGTGVGDRVSRVSFADSSFTGKETGGGNRRSSYFANGPGTASSPNAHRYKASQGNSISGNSIFNMYGGGKDAPAMPRIPIPAVFNKDRDVTKGVEASTARDLSAEDLAGIVVNAPGVYSPESFETAALPSSRSADENLNSMTSGDDGFLAVGDNNNNKKHNITISTSMPRLANPQGRQSILSPDDMLRAYASKTAIAGPSPRPLLSNNNHQDLTSSMSVPTMSLRNDMAPPPSSIQQRPDTFMSDYSKYPDEDLEEFVSVHPTHEVNKYEAQDQERDQVDEGSTSGKKGIFNTKFKFGNSSK